jgi:gag-polypeptide of LTR copia-type/Zinc knuckle
MATTGADTTTKGLLVPFFDGDPNKFKGWWIRFRAYATIKNFASAIERTKETDLPATETTDVSSDKPKKSARDRNMMAVACLTATFQDDGLLNIVEQSMTGDWPSGLACVIIDELFKRYRPVDIISRVELRTRLNHVSMKKDDDPRVLFDQLASIQSAYNDVTRKIDPDDLIAVVLEKAPEQYKSILTAEQRYKGSSLTLADLRSCMNDLYRTKNPTKNDNRNETEVSLAAPSIKFNGICEYCKKPGHMARDCRKKKADHSKDNRNNTNTFTPKNMRPCRHCGGKHM